MSGQLRQMVIKTITGETYKRTFTPEDLAEINEGSSTGVQDLVTLTAEVLGAASDRNSNLKINDATVGWVALNPRHVVAVEFHGTNDLK